MSQSYRIEPIAYCHSPFKQKFGVPHQAGLVPSIHSRIELTDTYAKTGVLNGLGGCSHIWLLFIFNQNIKEGWRPTVKPPRHQQRLGVFASRSPHRPNFIGQSVVELVSVHENANDMHLIIAGGDLVDATPIIDIKPYLPQGDAVNGATFNFESLNHHTINTVRFEHHAKRSALKYAEVSGRDIIREIEEILRADPRPRQFRDTNNRNFGFTLYDLNIKWHVELDQSAVVTQVE